MKETACKGDCTSSSLEILHGTRNAEFLIHKNFFEKTCILPLFAIFNCYTEYYLCVGLFQTCTNLHTCSRITRFHQWKRPFPPMETPQSYVCFNDNVWLYAQNRVQKLVLTSLNVGYFLLFCYFWDKFAFISELI